MTNHWLLIIAFIFVATLATLNAMALHFYWYWTLRWFDIPMHLLGGMWAATMAMWALTRRVHNYSPRSQVFFVLFFVLVVGIVWELFEALFLGIYTEPGYLFDTAQDLLSDLCGGAIGYLLALRLTRPFALESRLS